MTANYDQPKDVVKRTRFFDGQFLKDQDFIDDQKYHIDRQRRPNRLLRVSGICEGLTVEVTGEQVTVTPGTALDSQGRLIVLTDSVPVILNDQTGALDIFISYGQEESDRTQPGNDRSSPEQGAIGATRWLERPQIDAVQDRASLKGVSPIWLGRVTVTGSGTNRTVALTTLAEREYTGIYLPSGANPFEAPVLRSGGNPNPKLAILTGDLRIRGTTADDKSASLNVTNSNPASTSLLYVRNDGNVGIGTTTPTAKLAINGGLHVGGDSDPGDNNLLVDGTLRVTGNSTLTGTLTVTGSSTLNGGLNVAVNQTVRLELGPNQKLSLGGNGAFEIDAPDVVGGRFKVSDNGTVGIGTNDPKAKLAINGGLHVGGDSDPGDNNLLVDGTLAVTGNSTLTGTLTVTGNSTLTGNVGIGTTAPLAKLAINGGLHVGGDSDPGDNNLLVDGKIQSPMWKVTSVFDNQSVADNQTTLTATFSTNGGTIVIFASGSGISKTGANPIGLNISINGKNSGSIKAGTQGANVRYTFVSNAIIVPGLAAKSDNGLVLTPDGNTTINKNDFFSLTILELPF
jgi:hypothetical protein